MRKIENGGPAFPFAATDPSNVQMQAQGMSLRDWFAGQAMTIVYMRFDTSADLCTSDLAMQAYFIADAMLEARKVQP